MEVLLNLKNLTIGSNRNLAFEEPEQSSSLFYKCQIFI
jgi:hypothetical protein